MTYHPSKFWTLQLEATAPWTSSKQTDHAMSLVQVEKGWQNPSFALLYMNSLSVSYKPTLAPLRLTTCRHTISQITETTVPSKMSMSRRKQHWITAKIKRLAPRSVFLFNASLQQGTAPSAWKKEIFLKGDCRNPANYRSISLTSIWRSLSNISYIAESWNTSISTTCHRFGTRIRYTTGLQLGVRGRASLMAHF